MYSYKDSTTASTCALMICSNGEAVHDSYRIIHFLLHDCVKLIASTRAGVCNNV